MFTDNKNSNNNPHILIVEDDPEQMELLVQFTLSEINTLIDSNSLSDAERQHIKSIQIIKVNNIGSLLKAATTYKNTLLAVLDCNIPDKAGGESHDQLVKTNHRITGQHHSVDIVSEHLPDTPITMISSLNRFQKILSQYYERERDLSINYISKSDLQMVQRNIGYYLRQHLRTL